MGTADISLWRMAAGYLLLLIPLAIMLWYRVPLVGRTVISIVRMTVQLLFVAFYLQVVFQYDRLWLNALWVLVMIAVADVSIVRHCDLRPRRFTGPVFLALVAGTAIPLTYLVLAVLNRPSLMEAQYVIPLGGMILGNCLRADVIGLSGFYSTIRKDEKAFQFSLAAGATFSEAIRPYVRESFRAALVPTVTTMATIGLVSLPGMMTGVILGGTNPATAIKYQIGIMIAIFTGTSITLLGAILLTARKSFSGYGVLDKAIFA